MCHCCMYLVQQCHIIVTHTACISFCSVCSLVPARPPCVFSTQTKLCVSLCCTAVNMYDIPCHWKARKGGILWYILSTSVARSRITTIQHSLSLQQYCCSLWCGLQDGQELYAVRLRSHVSSIEMTFREKEGERGIYIILVCKYIYMIQKQQQILLLNIPSSGKSNTPW